jgi:hypothetical protein
MADKQLRIITILSLALVVSLTIVSYSGAYIASTYARETESMAAQGTGQDIVDLFLVVPLLIISLIFINKNNKVAFYIYSGTVFYILYSFVIYSLGVNFNKLFLLYCTTLGLSLYIFILIMYEFSRINVENWFSNKVPVRFIAIYLILISIMFYLLWLKEIIPAILNNSIPKSVSDYNLLVNPVHVIDIAFALPGLIITAILLMKKHRLGYILTPIALVFTIILAIALTGMVILLKVRGIAEDTSVAGIFITLAVISSILLFAFLKNIKTIKMN